MLLTLCRKKVPLGLYVVLCVNANAFRKCKSQVLQAKKCVWKNSQWAKMRRKVQLIGKHQRLNLKSTFFLKIFERSSPELACGVKKNWRKMHYLLNFFQFLAHYEKVCLKESFWQKRNQELSSHKRSNDPFQIIHLIGICLEVKYDDFSFRIELCIKSVWVEKKVDSYFH